MLLFSTFTKVMAMIHAVRKIGNFCRLLEALGEIRRTNRGVR